MVRFSDLLGGAPDEEPAVPAPATPAVAEVAPVGPVAQVAPPAPPSVPAPAPSTAAASPFAELLGPPVAPSVRPLHATAAPPAPPAPAAPPPPAAPPAPAAPPSTPTSLLADLDRWAAPGAAAAPPAPVPSAPAADDHEETVAALEQVFAATSTLPAPPASFDIDDDLLPHHRSRRR